MKRNARDFVTLFNRFWYRDFPLSESHKRNGSRAEWTTHIGICVRSSADLMGYFTHFEQGNKTDAVIKDNTESDIAHIEWEWMQAFSDNVNEIEKLHASRKETEFSVFISYSRHEYHDENLKAIKRQWKKSKEPLIAILVTFAFHDKRRHFHNLESYEFRNGVVRKFRVQPALPWKVKGSRWESKS